MPLSLHIALRFLFRSRADRPLALFTLVSVFGIGASVLLFLLIDTVMNGFTVSLSETFVGFDAPLTLEAAPGRGESRREELAGFITRHPEFGLRFAEGREFFGMVRVGNEMPMGVKARAVDRGFFALKNDRMDVRWRDGFDAEAFLETPDAILIGAEMEKSLPLFDDGGEHVDLIHPFADLGPSGELEPQVKTFTVAGVIATGDYDIDNFYVFLPRTALSGFANVNLMTTKFFVYPESVLAAQDVKAAWLAERPEEHDGLKTWLDDNAALFKAMALERKVFVVIFALLVVISCLNLASVIRIFGIGKVHDAAVLRSLGAGTKLLRGIYVNIGLILGAVGGATGLAIGLSIVAAFRAGEFRLPAAYGFGKLPLAVNPATAAALFVLAPLLSAAVAYWPALKIAHSTVTETLRDA